MPTEAVDSFIGNRPKVTSTEIMPVGIFNALCTHGFHDARSAPKLAGKGEEATVWNLSKELHTIRIPHRSIDLETCRIQKSNQTLYFYGVIGGYRKGRIPHYIRVPFIWNDSSMSDTGLPEGSIIMQTIKGRTLEYYLIKEYLLSKGIIGSASDISHLTDMEINNFYLGINRGRFRGIPVENGIKRMFGSAVGEEFSRTLSFLSKYGINHNDLHNGNIMIEDDPADSRRKIIYIIDFGKTKVDIVKASDLINEGRNAYNDPNIFGTIWEEKGVQI